ncbi:MAG TPA: YdbL family protein [Alphaproteobacteria bacterium]|nr:YdbL family protein [Alphaproteobacteria bacterium]
MSFKFKSLIAGLLTVLTLAFAAPAMADPLDDARAAGQIGERPDGYVAAVSGSAPGDIQALVQSTNAKRQKAYQDIATKQGVPVEQVGALTAEKIIGKMPAGWYYMNSSGAWVQK